MAYRPIRSDADLAARLVTGATREAHDLEFKGLNAKGWPYSNDDKGRDECRRDIAQFANALGGTLVLGAEEDDHVLKQLVTVPQAHELLHWVDQIAKEKLEPIPIIDPFVVRDASGNHVVVVNVPASLRLVGLRVKEGYEFPLRTADSKRYLRLPEIEARMHDRDRIHRLRLEQIGREEPVGLDGHIDRDLGHDKWNVVRVDDDFFVLKKIGTEVTVPLAYVEAVYRAAGLPNAHWIVALSCWLSKHRQQPLVTVTKDMPFGRNSGHYRSRGMDSETT